MCLIKWINVWYSYICLLLTVLLLTNLKFELKFCESPRSIDDFHSFFLMQIYGLI